MSARRWWRRATAWIHGPAEQPRAQGQVLVLYAVSILFFATLLGFAVDGGMLFAGRRAAQAAADAGALAGARVVSKSAYGINVKAWGQIQEVVETTDTFGTLSLEKCFYIDGGGTEFASCHAPVPSMAVGVRVYVQEIHTGFLLDKIFGYGAATTNAKAAAQVFLLATIPSNAPFLVCGENTTLASGGQFSIAKNGRIDPAAVGKTYIIHGPGVQSCITRINPGENPFQYFKGVADQTQNANKGPGDRMYYLSTNNIGPLQFTVPGAQGCQAGAAMNNCVIYLPVVLEVKRTLPPTPTPLPTVAGQPSPTPLPTLTPTGPPEFVMVGVVPFYIQKISNEHHATLLGGYLAWGPSGDVWLPGDPRPAMVRLIE